MSAKSALDPSWFRILVVDDEPMVLNVLKDQLQPEGYNVTAVEGASKALDLLQKESFAVILVDHEMPGMTGLDLLAKLKESHPTITRLLLSSGLTLSALSEAIKSDTIYRFVTKPWLREELLVTLRNAIVHNRLVTENKALHERNVHLNLKITKLAEAEQHAVAAAEAAAQDAPAFQPAGFFSAEEGATEGPSGAAPPPPGVDLAVQAFQTMLYEFYPNLGSTAARAVAVCQTLGEVLELQPQDLKDLLWAASLHDIGLVGTDINVVRRWQRGSQSDDDMALIKKHPERSQKMLDNFEFFKGAAEILLHHHEHWDGTGYPDQLKEQMIPQMSRLLAVVVAYCSKHAPGIQAMGQIETDQGTLWDPDAVSALAKAVPLTKLPRGEREIRLIELKAGMTLARDIHNANGFLLLPKGRELSEGSINKIWSIDKQTPINPYVLVYC